MLKKQIVGQIFLASFILCANAIIHPAAAPKATTLKTAEQKKEQDMIEALLQGQVRLTQAEFDSQSFSFQNKVMETLIDQLISQRENELIKENDKYDPRRYATQAEKTREVIVQRAIPHIIENNCSWLINLLIEPLEKAGVNLNTPIKNQTPLTRACAANQPDVVNALLQAGANPTNPNNAGLFQLAVSRNYPAVISSLINGCRKYFALKLPHLLKFNEKDLAQFHENQTITPFLKILSLGDGEGELIIKHLSAKDRENFKRTCRTFAKYTQHYEKKAYSKLWDTSNKQRFTNLIRPALEIALQEQKTEIADTLTQALSEGYVVRA